MMLVVRVEMRARRLEVGRITLCHLMKMHRMLSGRHVVQGQIHFYSAARGTDHRPANALTVGILDLSLDLLRFRERRERKSEQKGHEEKEAKVFHGKLL